MKITLFLAFSFVSASGIFGFMQDYKMVYETPYGDRKIGYYKTLPLCNKDKAKYLIVAKRRYKDTTVVCKPTFIKKLKTEKGTDNANTNQRILD